MDGEHATIEHDGSVRSKRCRTDLLIVGSVAAEADLLPLDAQALHTVFLVGDDFAVVDAGRI
jgi:hypothetical protein